MINQDTIDKILNTVDIVAEISGDVKLAKKGVSYEGCCPFHREKTPSFKVSPGQNRLFRWLRANGYLCGKGEYYNQPTQRAMEQGLFEIKKTAITKPDGTVLTTTTTKITGKGQVYFVDKFLNSQAAA